MVVNEYKNVDCKGERFRIVDYQKPHHLFSGHFVIQSLHTGKVQKAFKHELCQGQAVVTDHDDFYTENSQSDVELGNIDMPNAENLEQDIIGNLLKGTLPI
jgi:hypothetical protein